MFKAYDSVMLEKFVPSTPVEKLTMLSFLVIGICSHIENLLFKSVN
jgi:hypothetical protein